MIYDVCIATTVIFCAIVIAYFLFSSKSFKYDKEIEENKTKLTITANQNLKKISVIAKFGNESITFERKRIRKGQTVDFVYPVSKKPARLTVVEESGKEKICEV